VSYGAYLWAYRSSTRSIHGLPQIQADFRLGAATISGPIGKTRGPTLVGNGSGGHTGGASGAVHQGPRPLGAHQPGPDSNLKKN